MIRLMSQLDASQNFIINGKAPGEFLECRYVRRAQSYISAYLSSAHGCSKGCAMCHLTTSKQTSVRQARPQDYDKQAQAILDYYQQTLPPQIHGRPAEVIYWNFMARGEPLDNPTIMEDWHDLAKMLDDLAGEHGLLSRFNISTIMPFTLESRKQTDFRWIFDTYHPIFYYSLYRTDLDWRDKWLPSAFDPKFALEILKKYQDFSKRIVKIHYALIAGENDSYGITHHNIAAVKKAGLVAEVNLVKFNPAEGSEFKDSNNYDITKAYWENAGFKCTIKERVGMDVHASCGTFFGA